MTGNQAIPCSCQPPQGGPISLATARVTRPTSPQPPWLSKHLL
jgi:hypothetical protein